MSQTRLAKANVQSKWNGEHRSFYSWNTSVIKDLRSEGLEACIRPNFLEPIVPLAALEAVENNRGTVVQNSAVYQYQTKLEQNDVKCQKSSWTNH
jgi:hypothetical protein